MSVYMYRRNVSNDLNVRMCAYIYILQSMFTYDLFLYIEREICKGFNCPTHYYCNMYFIYIIYEEENDGFDDDVPIVYSNHI